MEEKTPNQFTLTISFQWRLLAAICVVMPGLVLFAFFSLADAIQPVYTAAFGDKPLPGITMFVINYGLWVKWLCGILLFGLAVWLMRSRKTLPFFYAALAMIISNLLSVFLLSGILLPFVEIMVGMKSP